MRRLIPRPLVALAAGLSAALVGAVLTVGSADAAAVSYVALGDSYAAGLGSGSYLAASGSCDRSTLAYPRLWAKSHAPSSFAFVACSGATTTDLLADQLGPLSRTTTLVTVTIGGNDVNFSGVMTDCVLYSTATCVNDVSAAENQARTVLPGRLDTVYNAIRSHAPNAKVVVLDYPHFYHVGVWWCVGLSDTARSKINEGADVLDTVISQAAARHGFTFADVRSRFGAGHEICDSSSWLHSVDWTDIAQSYHPTASGQSGGYYPTLTAVTG